MTVEKQPDRCRPNVVIADLLAKYRLLPFDDLCQIVPMNPLIAIIEPIYGNGWVSYPDEQSRDTPPSFAIDFTGREKHSGVIVTANHEFERAVVSLTPRYAEPTDIFNVEVRRGSTVIARGYARCG
jgi:hypothetical protein